MFDPKNKYYDDCEGDCEYGTDEKFDLGDLADYYGYSATDRDCSIDDFIDNL